MILAAFDCFIVHEYQDDSAKDFVFFKVPPVSKWISFAFSGFIQNTCQLVDKFKLPLDVDGCVNVCAHGALASHPGCMPVSFLVFLG